MLMTRAQRARLGFFFVAVVGLLVATGFLLLGRQALRPSQIFLVRFHESVSGLEQSAAVRYQGLHVGQVAGMQVAADDSQAIEVSLAIDANIALFEGTQAQLDLSGLTGLKAINLVPGDPRSRRLEPGEMIPESVSGFGHLTENAAAVIANIKSISDQLGALVTTHNRVRFEHLLGGIDTLVGHANHFLEQEQDTLGSAVRDFAETTRAVGRTAEAATKLITEGQASLGRLERQIERTLVAIERPLGGLDAKSVRDTLSNLEQAGRLLSRRLSDKEAGVAIAAVGDTAERINHLVQDVDLAVRAGREDFAKSLSYLRQAAEDLREFSRILAQNPSVLVRGRNNAD